MKTQKVSEKNKSKKERNEKESTEYRILVR